MSNSRALVIKSIKQGETSSIVSCYLEEIGYKSFLVKGLYSSKKSKFSKAHFFPLNLINIHYSFNEKKNLGFIKEVKSEVLFNTIHSDVQKSSVIVFLSEIDSYLSDFNDFCSIRMRPRRRIRMVTQSCGRIFTAPIRPSLKKNITRFLRLF